MSLGIILALASMFFGSVTNAIQEFIANTHKSTSLLLQYICLVVVAAVVLLVMQDGLVVLTPRLLGLLALSGAIGYTGIWCLFEGLRRLDLGITMMIASSYVFIGYFLNRWMFPEIEALPFVKIILAVVFFVVISLFLIHRDRTTQELTISTDLLYPLGTAVCWSIFFALLNLFLKGDYLTPFQSVLYTEGTILIVAFLHVVLRGAPILPTVKPLIQTGGRIYLIRAMSNYVMGLTSYYAYVYVAANTVNIIRLFTIIISALFGYIFFKQTLSKRELILMSLSFLLLLGFVFV